MYYRFVSKRSTYNHFIIVVVALSFAVRRRADVRFMHSQTLLATLQNIQVHDHLCLIYETRDEQFDAVIPFMQFGLERGEKMHLHRR